MIQTRGLIERAFGELGVTFQPVSMLSETVHLLALVSFLGVFYFLSCADAGKDRGVGSREGELEPSHRQ